MADPSQPLAGSGQSLPSSSRAREPEAQNAGSALEIEQGRSTSEKLAAKLDHLKDRAHEERDEFRQDFDARKAVFKASRLSA